MHNHSWRITPSKLIVFQVYFNIIVKFLINDINFPSSINYVSDLITVILALFLIKRTKKQKCFVYALFLTYIGLGVFSSLINGVDTILIMWALRNFGRFVIWIMATIEFVTQKDIEKMFIRLNRFLGVNLIFMVFQYMVLGLRSDYLNGFFGSYTGGNSALNTFFVIMTVENIAAYLTRRRTIKKVMLNIAFMSMMSALNELKFYFVELVIIVILSLWFVFGKRNDAKTKRKIFGIICFVACISVIGYNALIYFYPGFSGFLNKTVLLDYLTRSYNSSEINYVNGVKISNRFTAYGIIVDNFFTDWFKVLFGIGMGAAEYSNFFRGSFMINYGEAALTGYALPHILLENGFLGLALFVGILLSIGFNCKNRIAGRHVDKYIFIISGVVSLMGIIICMYNASIRIESGGYFFYMIIALALSNKVNKEYDKIFKRNC